MSSLAPATRMRAYVHIALLSVQPTLAYHLPPPRKTSAASHLLPWWPFTSPVSSEPILRPLKTAAVTPARAQVFRRASAQGTPWLYGSPMFSKRRTSTTVAQSQVKSGTGIVQSTKQGQSYVVILPPKQRRRSTPKAPAPKLSPEQARSAEYAAKYWCARAQRPAPTSSTLSPGVAHAKL